MADKTLRLFFALPCPPGLAARICAWRDKQAFEGVAVPEANLHLTLAFLGSQPAARLDALCSLADGIRAPSFTVQLNQTALLAERFACLVPETTPDALLALVAQLGAGLAALGIKPDPRPFQPHVTLLRRACGQARTAPALCWSARQFTLYASHADSAGVRYEALASWPLQAPP